MRAGIVLFPGTNRERDMEQALHIVSGEKPTMLWHRDTQLPKLDLIIIPGGFSFGDYLRSGAMAAHSPIMREIAAFADRGGYILGVCNGFQVLTECRLLPGALLRNSRMRFLAQDTCLRVDNADSVFTYKWKVGDVFRVPLAHGDGNYTDSKENLDSLEAEGRVVLRYVDTNGERNDHESSSNPNGSQRSIAGVLSSNRRICGLMPHPENRVDPALGPRDGAPLFAGLVERLVA